MNNFYILPEPNLKNIDQILTKSNLNKEDIMLLLSIKNKDSLKHLYDEAYKIKKKIVGAKTYFRGLIEYSNICDKNCSYCGIRHDNKSVNRYFMKDEDVYEAMRAAYKYGYASLVIQAGERTDSAFIDKMNQFLKKAKKISNNEIGITLSVGEQSEAVYKEFRKNGAHRYLLRIETINKELYEKIHPADHSFENRLNCLRSLKNLDYQTGTGVMIGLPEQTIEDLANDLLFFKEFDIDMVGMGPYIEHEDTPLYIKKNLLLPISERFELSIKMIALLRILMKDINIASSTALQAINPVGREIGLQAGANVIMPNLTPIQYRGGYQLYENKPCLDEEANKCRDSLSARIESIGDSIGYNEWGDSKHYFNRIK